MKYIVPTTTRVGASLVCEILSHLTSQEINHCEFDHPIGQRLSNANLDKLLSTPGIVRTTSAYAPDFLLLPGSFHIISIQRQLLTTICSQLLFCKNVLRRDNLPIPAAVKRVLNAVGNIDDTGFLNLFIEANEAWVLDEARKWRRSNAVVVNKKITQVKFEKVSEEPAELVKKLAKLVGAGTVQIKKAEEAAQFSVMRKKFSEGTLRSGGLENYEKMLDDGSKAVIQRVLKQVNNERIL